jgi:hypothetical protein
MVKRAETVKMNLARLSFPASSGYDEEKEGGERGEAAEASLLRSRAMRGRE